MKIAIASGKGGTGKTTVSVNMYYFINLYVNNNVHLVDCDVEEPNDALFFPKNKKISEQQIFQLIPEIDLIRCTYCRKCADWCEFNAISIIKSREFARVNHDLCHSCGACIVACEFGAITEHEQPLGVISHFDVGIGKGLTEGRLKIGSAMQTMLIKAVKKNTRNSAEIIIYDAPPGTSCPVVETVANADYIVLVTEPTPFGLHDLKITVELLNDLQKPFGVIVNKAGLGNNDVYRYLNENQIELLGRIPFMREYAASYAEGQILKNIPDEIKNTYLDIIKKIQSKTGLK
ncbi:MAG: ATP-binding protein [Prolixibacteraceae bacterium]|nr:ATP-binding protein [Prolixibacteraceae bacterium]